MSAERLVYVMGPSGAGKDSLLAYARKHVREPEGRPVKEKFSPKPA